MNSMGSGWENLKIQLALKGLNVSTFLKNYQKVLVLASYINHKLEHNIL